MRARQRWSKNNALAEICSGEIFEGDDDYFDGDDDYIDGDKDDDDGDIDDF